MQTMQTLALVRYRPCPVALTHPHGRLTHLRVGGTGDGRTQKRKRAIADGKSAQAQAVVLGLEDGTVLVVSIAKGDLALTLQGYARAPSRPRALTPVRPPARALPAFRSRPAHPASLRVRARRGHTRRVNAVAGRADGTALFTAGDDGLVIQWNLATGEQISYVPRGQARAPPRKRGPPPPI